MRTIQHSIAGLLLVSSAAFLGCQSGSEIPAGDEPVASSEARITVATTGKGSATLHVTAIEDASSAIKLDKSVTVTGGDVAMFELGAEPSSYTFHVDVFADQAEAHLLGSGSSQVDLAAGQTTEVH